MVVAALVAGTVAIFGFRDSSSPRKGPLSEQVDTLRSDLARDGYHVSDFRRLELRPGLSSVLVALVKGQRKEVRIYDYVDGRLERTFGIAPKLWAPDDLGGRPDVSLPAFEFASVLDLNDDPDAEILGSFDASLENATTRVPVTISWDDKARRYQLAPLLLRPTRFRGAAPSNSNDRLYQQTALERPRIKYEFTDRATGRGFDAYGLTSFAVVKGSTGSPYLLGALRIHAGRSRDATSLVELRLWGIFEDRNRLAAGYCEDIGGVRFPLYYRFEIPVGDDYSADLKRAWKQIGPLVTSTVC